jgi:hypothetical protein
MTRVSVLPHRTAARGIETGPWSVFLDRGRVRPNRRIAWDRSAPIELRCEVTLDPDRVRDQCHLGPGAGLVLIATWQCVATSMRTVGAKVGVDVSASYPLTVSIDPRWATGEVTVVRTLVVASPGDSGEPLTADRRGAIVWREHPRDAITLTTDDGGRFTTDVIDFRDLDDTDSEAAWRLDVDLADLLTAPARALRLVVNSSHPAIDRLLSATEDESSEEVQSVLRWDVARLLVDRALDEDDFVEGFTEFPPDSVGGALQALFARWLPDSDPRDLRRLRELAPARYESHLQARLQLLRSS